MKIRKSAATTTDKVELQMTPMIDVVFQLIAFFMFTFTISAQEGDFNIKMPIAAPAAGQPPEQFPPIHIRLSAGPKGELAGIQLGDRQLANFAALNQAIIEIVGNDTGPNSLAANAEVELDADYTLKYENIVRAITAVSGYIDQSGNVVKLIEKLKFSPPKPPQ